MAIPTFTSITPATGLAVGGLKCVIAGTNFRETPAQVAGQIGGDTPDTVVVSINGVDVGTVAVIGSTRLKFNIPAFSGDVADLPLDVDIRIANIDDDGDEITDENVTEEDGFQYYQKDLTGYSHLAAVCAELIRSIRRGVMYNVSMSSHVDYSPEDGLALRAENLASLPVINLTGPDLQDWKEDIIADDEEDGEGNPLYEGEEGTDDDYEKEYRPYIADAFFQVVGASDNQVEAVNLAESFMEWVRLTKQITVPINPADLSRGYHSYELEFDTDSLPKIRKVQTLTQWNARIFLEAVHIAPEEQAIVDGGSTVYDGTDAEWANGLPNDWITLTEIED